MIEPRKVKIIKRLTANMNVSNQEYINDRKEILDTLYDNLFGAFTDMIQEVPMFERGAYMIMDFKVLEMSSLDQRNTMDMKITAKVGIQT